MSDGTAAVPSRPTLQVSTAINSTDHGQVVVLAGWISLLIGIVLSAVRVYLRWPPSAFAGKDDVAYTLAFLLAITQTAIALDAVKGGFGRINSQLEESQSANIAKAIYTTNIIFLLSLWAGKLSVSLLFTRLAKESNKVRLEWMFTTMVSVFSIVSIFSGTLRRNISQPWVYEDADVSANQARWIATGVLSIVTDLVVMILAISLVWRLQMRSQSKSLVITVFALRLFVTPVSVVRLVSLGSVRAAWNTDFMDIRLEEIDNNAFREHVTSHSDLKSKSSALIPGPGGSSQSHGSHFALWNSGGGSSKAQVETGAFQEENDAASDSSERGIVVKTTVDVTNGLRSP